MLIYIVGNFFYLNERIKVYSIEKNNCCWLRKNVYSLNVDLLNVIYLSIYLSMMHLQSFYSEAILL